MNLTNFTLGQNTGQDLLTALVIFIGALVVLKIFNSIILLRLKKAAEKSATDFDDMLIKIVSNIKPPFYFFLALYVGIQFLILSQIVSKIITIIFVVIVVYEVINALQKIIEYSAQKALAKKGEDEESAESTIKTLSVIIKIVLWSFGIILILSNIGVDITSLVAGLGIGGVAVALAMQNILGDIFSSFSIVIDKPFEIGDFIVVDKDMGIVEKIGIKTTRLRTLQGEQLVISNQELTTVRVQNFKRMEKRRVAFELGVIYETSADKLKKIPDLVEEVITNVSSTEFDRCHFKAYGDFSLIFEIVYYALTGDYNEYMDIHQEINLKIFEVFKSQGIEFAYPTQVEYQKKV